jgi:hypothetical protein
MSEININRGEECKLREVKIRKEFCLLIFLTLTGDAIKCNV